MNGQSRSILSENGEWILSAIKRNPEGLLLLAAGAALLLRTGSRPSGGARSMAAAYGGDHHASGPGAVQSAVRQTIDAASDAARQTAETAASYASHLMKRSRWTIRLSVITTNSQRLRP